MQVSCFGLAVMAATVAAGRAVTPKLWRDLETTVGTGYEAPPADVVGSLRTMMRDVVTSGRGTALPGTATCSARPAPRRSTTANAHGWFAGYRDDVAFATLVLDGESSTSAVAVTGAFLGALG